MYGPSISANAGASISGFAPFADNAAGSTPSKMPDAVALAAEQLLLKDSRASFLDDAVAPSIATAAGATVASALCTVLPEEAVGSLRGKRDASTSKFTIEHVDGPLDELIKSDRIRGELDKVVDTVKGMDVKEIEIKAYFPFFSEFAKPRADAVKNFLVYRGVDADVITLTPRGPGYASKHAALAKARAVVIEITGTPKQAPQAVEAAQPATPPGRYLLA